MTTLVPVPLPVSGSEEVYNVDYRLLIYLSSWDVTSATLQFLDIYLSWLTIFSGDSREPKLSQVVFQVFSWWMLFKSVELCCPWWDFVLQTSFFTAFQGERQLQSFNQVCFNEASSSNCSRFLNYISDNYFIQGGLIFLYLFFFRISPIGVPFWFTVWSDFHNCENLSCCCCHCYFNFWMLNVHAVFS